MKNVGILLAISSLPGQYGGGDFSKCAYDFIDILKKNSIRYWQILPLNPIGYGHSPYQPYSSFAFDEIYIDVNDLIERKLIPHNIAKLPNTSHTDYEVMRSYKDELITASLECYISEPKNYKKLLNFIENNKYIDEYSTFMAKKEINHNKSWNLWDEDSNNLDSYTYKRKLVHAFAQMLLLEEWLKIKKYANKKGIDIIGDVPFYVGYDSSDVYYHKSNFLLNEDNSPTLIAGVPPDYFSSDGQRWGNPIYNFDYLKDNKYQFLIDRLSFASKLYNKVRIDHFRAFDSYWVINPSCNTAIDGYWKYPDGYDFFNTLYEYNKDIDIIAEDLGLLREEVYKLRDYYNLPGMHVLQFTIFDDEFNNNRIEKINNIYYTGTHDNETLSEWLSKQDKEVISKLKNKMNSYGYKDKELYKSLIRYSLSRKEDTIIFPLQDIMNLDKSYRMNIPSVINEVNWTFKLRNYKKCKESLKFIKDIIKHA